MFSGIANKVDYFFSIVRMAGQEGEKESEITLHLAFNLWHDMNSLDHL